jgi:hypothetical protein
MLQLVYHHILLLCCFSSPRLISFTSCTVKSSSSFICITQPCAFFRKQHKKVPNSYLNYNFQYVNTLPNVFQCRPNLSYVFMFNQILHQF